MKENREQSTIAQIEIPFRKITDGSADGSSDRSIDKSADGGLDGSIDGSYQLEYDSRIEESYAHLLKQPVLKVILRYPDGKRIIYPIFQQNAGLYQAYSAYMNSHGCACCSLTSMLNAKLGDTSRDREVVYIYPQDTTTDYDIIYPQDTIAHYEKEFLTETSYIENYRKPLPKQMPVSLYGISKILAANGIHNHYVGAYREKQAMQEITAHLRSGRPVVFETSRLRHKGPLIFSINDKKYAGSYHTMIMLGLDREGKVVFTDSATRAWAGDIQRLKRAELSELMTYMFPQKKSGDKHEYFHHRSETGGYILVE